MSTSTRTNGQIARTAVLGLTAAILATLLAVNFNRLPLVGGGLTEYKAEFTDASGLVEGEEVRIAGIKVGTVTDIALDGDKVVVTFGVSGVELGDQSTASIEVKTLLGQHHLAVTPQGSGTLEQGATIPVQRTSTPLNIVPAFNQLADHSAKIDTQQLAAAFNSLAELAEDTAPHVRGTLRGLSRLSRTVSSRDVELKELLARANQVSGVVAARDRELGELLTSSLRVLTVLRQQRTTIDRLIAGTTALSLQLTGLVRDNQADAHIALERLNGVLAVLRDNRAEIDRIIELGAVYGRVFVNTVGTGPWFDGTNKYPNGMTLCHAGGTGPFDGLLADAFVQGNNGKDACLPLGESEGGPS
ncbi:MCE family protein [Nocardioides antri]|uniref:MCE family protein n=1 Tax=Nocardioides antri TaxID=2607659 RepID=A0A5B1M5A7_9ACTN|nr:MCE family protein [Nocardioides antri]KAA1427816.1 MCE family protein [Nocardioides antri]